MKSKARRSVTEKELAATMERIKGFEKRALTGKSPSKTRKAYKPVVRTVNVERNSVHVYKFTGQHVQFDLDWHPDAPALLRVWGMEDYKREKQSDGYVSILNQTDRYVLRFT